MGENKKSIWKLLILGIAWFFVLISSLLMSILWYVGDEFNFIFLLPTTLLIVCLCIIFHKLYKNIASKCSLLKNNNIYNTSHGKKLIFTIFIIIISLTFSIYTWTQADKKYHMFFYEPFNISILPEFSSEAKPIVEYYYNHAFQEIILFNGVLFACAFFILKAIKKDK